MKKYIVLGLVTLILLAGARFLPDWIEASVVRTTIVTVKKGSYTEIVTGNGTMEYSDKTEIKTSIPFIPAEVYVEPGDQVEIGDTVAKIDKQQTLDAVMGLLNLGGIDISEEVSEVFSGQSDQISDLAELLPETVSATASGTVTAVSLVKDAVAMPDTALVTIAASDRLQAAVAVSEASAAKIKEGQQVTVTSSALKGKTYRGTVTGISPTARKQYSGTVQQTVVDVMIDFDETDTAMKAGYSVKAEIVTGAEREFPCLPYEAVSQDDTGEYVYTYQSGRAEKKYITTGVELEAAVEITSGIEAEDRILNHAQSLSEHQLVRVTAIE